MAPIKFLLALSSLAIFSCTLGARPANALAVDSHHVNRHVAHGSIAKKKRDSSRCKNRPISSTPTSSPKPTIDHTATPPASNGGGGKVCIAWGGDDAELHLVKSRRTNLLYNWSPTPPPLAASLGFTLMTQLWGSKDISEFQHGAKPGAYHFAMGFNEPNEPKQSNMGPDEGARLWMDFIQPLAKDGYKLLSPATSSNPNGMVWVKNFMKACTDCTFDYICLHWYDVSFDKFKTYVTLWHDTFHLPIMITEFALQNYNDGPDGPQPNANEVWEFYTQAMQWLDELDWVFSYCPFGFMDNLPDGVNEADALLKGGQLTPLGEMIINGPTT
jgi:hypothetical protein